MQRKFVTGRGRGSHMLVAWRHVHVFVWVPWWGSHSTGITMRVRWRGGWTHYRLTVLQRNRPGAFREGHFFVRPTLTLAELSSWRTAPGTHGRVGLKRYVRLKVSLGGREVTGTLG